RSGRRGRSRSRRRGTAAPRRHALPDRAAVRLPRPRPLRRATPGRGPRGARLALGAVLPRASPDPLGSLPALSPGRGGGAAARHGGRDGAAPARAVSALAADPLSQGARPRGRAPRALARPGSLLGRPGPGELGVAADGRPRVPRG